MGKINSLSKIFSGLSSSPKELNFFLGNSTFLAAEQQQKLKYNENNNLLIENTQPSPSVKLLERPPKSQRSRSQGSKKDGRYKTTQQSTSQIIENNGYLPQKLSPEIKNNGNDLWDERFSSKNIFSNF
jgi:hypothetical protein